MRAFTLIEVLAVVVLLGLGASVATVSLAGATDAAAAERAISIIRDADARARLLSGRGQTASLQTVEHAGLTVTSADGERREFGLPASCRVYLLDADGRELRSVAFDARGRSPDYSVLCRRAADQASATFAGLTGWSTVEREVSP